MQTTIFTLMIFPVITRYCVKMNKRLPSLLLLLMQWLFSRKQFSSQPKVCYVTFHVLKGQCHDIYGYFLESLKILVSTVCVWTDGFHCSIQLLSFYLLLWIYLLILKMLTETLLRIPFSGIGRRSLVPTSHWLQEKCTGIYMSQAISNMILQNHRRHFQCQNRRFRIFEAGYWKDF